MKILIYSINFAPELTGIGKYTGEMAAWLAAKGHDVRVVTAPPYYPNWSVAPGYSRFLWQRENWHEVDVWRCPLWVPKYPGGIRRLLHLASFALTSFPVMCWQALWRPDWVWVVEPPLFCSPAALLLARVTGRNAWLHIQDFEVDAAFSLGILKGQRLLSTVQWAERWLMQRFDVVSSISHNMLKRAESKGVPPERLAYFPNWVDFSEIPAQASGSPRPQAYRRQFNLKTTDVVALYSGNMGRKQGLELLPELAKRVPEVQFVFCGEGVARGEIEHLCAGLDNVRMADLQPAERLGDFLAMADIHLLPQREGAADLVMPSKLLGMLASARPVVTTAHAKTELAEIANDCGLVVAPGDIEAMAGAVNRLAQDPVLRQVLGSAGLIQAQTLFEKNVVLSSFEKRSQCEVS